MSNRFYLNVTNQSGQEIYYEQMLGKHKCFPKEYLDKLGVEVESDGLILEQVVDIHVFLDCFQNYYAKEVLPLLFDKTGKELLNSDMFIYIPSYTSIGHYAITQDALFKLSRLALVENLTATVSFS